MNRRTAVPYKRIMPEIARTVIEGGKKEFQLSARVLKDCVFFGAFSGSVCRCFANPTCCCSLHAACGDSFLGLRIRAPGCKLRPRK